MKGYQLKITIKGSKPPIWRRMVVPEQITFYQLHQVIQKAFGWWDDHLHEFEFKKPDLLVKSRENEDIDEWSACDVAETETLIDGFIKENPRFVYTYDFGDTWEHQILFEKEVEYEYRYPQVVKYKGDNIPEDCGGIGGYYDLLERLADPKAEDHRERMTWADEQGMEEYDLEDVNFFMKRKLLFEKRTQGQAARQQEVHTIKEEDSDCGPAVRMQTKRTVDPQTKVTVDPQTKVTADPQTVRPAAGTLEELYWRYDKSELLRIAKVHHIKGWENLGKGQLVHQLAEALLEPERMNRFFSSISDEAADVFEKVASGKGLQYQGDLTALSLLHDGGYCCFTNRGTAVAAGDVAEAYGAMGTEEFHSRRRRCHMVWSCCKACVCLYGVADAMQVETVCRAVGGDADAAEITRLYKEMKDIWTGFAYLGGLFFDWDLLGGNAYEKVFRYQQGKDHYIPTPAQAEEIARTGMTEPKKHVRPLKAFLLSMVGCDEETAAAAASSIHHHVRLGCTPGDVENIMEQFDLTLDSQEKMDGFDEIMEQVWKDTRTVGNCGYTRTELDAKTAHVDPNAPCPCGSGKRYRQCCGRK